MSTPGDRQVSKPYDRQPENPYGKSPEQLRQALDIDPDKALQLASEMEQEWAALLAHSVFGPFIRDFRILHIDEAP